MIRLLLLRWRLNRALAERFWAAFGNLLSCFAPNRLRRFGPSGFNQAQGDPFGIDAALAETKRLRLKGYARPYKRRGAA